MPPGCWPEGQSPDSKGPEGHLTDGGTSEQLETLALQLQALGAAVELGARPGGDRVTRPGIEARKLGHNPCRLSRAKGKGHAGTRPESCPPG